MNMKQGFRVFYDGERFSRDEVPSDVKRTPDDSTEMFFDTIFNAGKAANNLNHKLVDDPRKIRLNSQIIVQKCKDCGNYFMMDGKEIKWYEDKHFKIPVRCRVCRQKRKTK